MLMPSIIPVPTIEGYTLAPQKSFERTDMEAGPARQRRITTDNPDQVDVKWIMKRAEFAVFQAFYKHKLQEGATWFQTPLANGQGVNMVDARFVSPYTASAMGGLSFSVTAKLEVKDMPMMTEAELEAYLA